MKRTLSGVLLLDKPYAWSSNNAMQKVRWLLQAKKAGHTGILDPLATGLLPICFGEATKYAQRFLDADKGYIATIELGVRTTTADREGEIIETRPVTVDLNDVAAILPEFTGQIQQVPPAHSALKFQGKPMYEYARAGVVIEQVARAVEIFALQLRPCALPMLELEVSCSKGTYIRSLAEDIGKRLGCGAHLAGLRRTVTGGFNLSDAISLEALEALDLSARESHLLPVDRLVADLPVIRLDALLAGQLGNGQAVRHDGLFGLHRVYDPASRFLGLAEQREDGKLYPSRMMGNSALLASESIN